MIPSEPTQITTWALIVAGYLIAAAALSARYLPLLKVIVQRLPASYRWIPMAVGAASLPLQTSLPKAQNAQDVVEAIVVAAVAAWAAYEAGGKAPDHDDGPSVASKIGGGSTVLLVLMALGLGGCSPSLAQVSAATPDATDAPQYGVVPDDIPGNRETEDVCRAFSSREMVLRRVSQGLLVLGGGAGLTTIPSDDPQVDEGLAIGAATAAVVALGLEAWREQEAADYGRKCE
jgi:hypothetical protein